MNDVMPLAGTVALVRATHFGANLETLASNAFQSAVTEPDAGPKARAEQEALAYALQNAGIEVVWLDPPAFSRSPDGIFPNNWFSTHEDGTVIVYPMESPLRRTERMPDLAERLAKEGFRVATVIDIGETAGAGRFLEGTGSLILDRGNRVAYACASSRTDMALAEIWAKRFGYRLCGFDARDPSGMPVYHTNVIMSLGADLAIVCLDALCNADERKALREQLEATGKEIVAIDWQQVRAFAGNQLFLHANDGPVTVLSATADRALRGAQKAVIDRYVRRIAVDIATIERHGGGSVRCMLAEIFLPRLQAT